MRKIVLLIATMIFIIACNSGETKVEPGPDTSASSSADSIKNAVENSLKDTVLNPTDSVRGVDSVRK